MDNATAVSATNVSGGSLQSTIKDLPIAKVWAFAVGQFGWALLSGIISNWLVYFYQPDQETISQGQTVFVPQGLVVLGLVTVVGGITAFARFFDAFVDPAVASLSDRCDSKAGRRMPFLKFAALPLAVVTVLVFWSPINGTSWVNAAFLFVTVIGLQNTSTVTAASGRAARCRKGMRRPRGDVLRSDRLATAGSTKASKNRANAVMPPTTVTMPRITRPCGTNTVCPWSMVS